MYMYNIFLVIETLRTCAYPKILFQTIPIYHERDFSLFNDLIMISLCKVLLNLT